MDSDIGKSLQIFVGFVNCRYFDLFLFIFRMGKKKKEKHGKPLLAKN